MDSWCPSCGYSVEPGTRFCGGCGEQLAAQPGTAGAQPPTATAQATGAPFPGYPAYPAAPAVPPMSAPVAPPAPAAPPPPPPPTGSPMPWPPPPSQFPPPPGPPPPGAYQEQGPLPDTTVEQALRPQGLFQNSQQVPPSWHQPQPPAPGAGYPGAGYPPGGQYPPGGGAYQDPYGATQYAAPQYGTAQYGTAQFADGPYPDGPYPDGRHGQPNQGQVPPGQFIPGFQYGPDGMPLGGAGDPAGPAGAGPGGRFPFRRPKSKLVPVAVAAALVIIVAAALVLSSRGGSSPNSSGASAASGAAPTASASAPPAGTQQQAAAALSGLLQQSGGDRADVSAAVGDVEECGNSLTTDAQVFSKAAANRRTLLSKLAQLPGRSALSPAMISDLTAAWQASATVDADLAKWAQDQTGHCKKNSNKNDPNYAATLPFDSQATNAKDAFVQLWNPLAKKDGLPARQAGDL